MQSAKATADQQALLAARSAAEAKASDAVSQPLQSADVQLDDSGDSNSARNRRKASFGRNYSSGVSI